MLGTTDTLAEADWLHVSDASEIEWSGRPSRYTLLVPLGAAAVLAVAGVALTNWLLPVVEGASLPTWVALTPLVLTLFGVVWGIHTYFAWLRRIYVITATDVYVKYGILSRDITQIPLARVQNAGFDQALHERLLSFGDVHIFTAGSDTEDLTFESVPSPHRVAETLTVAPPTQADETPESLGAV